MTFQLLNETVSESLAVVDDVRDFHHTQITNLDAKVDENEDRLQKKDSISQPLSVNF